MPGTARYKKDGGDVRMWALPLLGGSPPEQFCSPRDIWQWRHFSFSWLASSRGQGCCETSYKAQDSPHHKELLAPMSIVPRLRKLAVDNGGPGGLWAGKCQRMLALMPSSTWEEVSQHKDISFYAMGRIPKSFVAVSVLEMKSCFKCTRTAAE